MNKWMKKIERAQRIKKNLRKESDRFKRGYMNDFHSAKNSHKSKNSEDMQVNFFYSTIELITPSIFSGKPRIHAKPKKDAALEQAAVLYKNNVNYWFQELDAKLEFGQALFDRFFQPGVIECGWDFKEEVQERVAEKDEEIEEGVFVGEGDKIKETVTVVDQPFIRALDYWSDITFDPDVKHESKKRWLAVREVVQIDEFKEMDKIPKKFRDKIKPTMRPEDVDPDQNNDTHDLKDGETSDVEWVVFWVVWDKVNRKRIIVHESIEKDLVKEEWPYKFEVGQDPYPVTILPAVRDPFSPHTFSEFKPIEDQIWERNRLRNVTQAIVRRLAPRYLFNKNTCTKAQYDKFRNSAPLSGTEMKNPGGLGLAPIPEIPSSFFGWDATVSNDLRDVSGLNEFENAVVEKTATQSSIDESKQSVRRGKRNTEFEEFVAKVGAKTGGLIQQLQEDDVTVKLSPDEVIKTGFEAYTAISKEDIQGEFHIEVEAGIMAHTNEATERRDGLRFAENMINNPHVDQRKIARMLSEAFNQDPDQVLLSEEAVQQKQQAAAQAEQEIPDPTVEFEKIKLEDMTPQEREILILEALKQVGAITPQEEQQGQQGGGLAEVMQLIQGGGQQGSVVPNDDGKQLPGEAQVPETPVQPASEEPLNV